MNKYEVSVVVACYNPDYKKLIYTLNSILMQTNVLYEIIVADDGSEENCFDDIKEYFDVIGFQDYKLVGKAYNRGTVINFLEGVRISDGKYIRGISPGDYLYGPNVLRKSIDYMSLNDYSAIGSDYVCYYFDDKEKIHSVASSRHPIYKNCTQEQLYRHYLLFNDIFCGVSTMYRKKELERYLCTIKDRVIYAEDNVIRLMAFNKERIGYFDYKTAVYEYGTGISTSRNTVWHEKLVIDWNNTNNIIINSKAKDDKLYSDFIIVNKFRLMPLGISKILLMRKIHGLIRYKIRARFLYPKTDAYLPLEWLETIRKL